MKLVEQHIFNKSSSRFESLDKICFLSKNLYNYSLYQIRTQFEKEGKWLRYNELEYKFKTENQADYRSLPNNSSQQILMLLDTTMKSYFSALKSWKKDKTKFKGLPKIPSFKHKEKGRNIVIFTYVQFRINGNQILFPKKSGLSPIKTKVTENIKQIRVIPRNDQYVVEVIYDYKEKEKNLNNKFLSIDLGLNNLASCTTSTLSNPFIINGKPLKSINQYYNKRLAKLKSELEKNHRRKSSKRIRKLTNKRNNKIKDYLHKASSHIIKHCIKNDIDNIVIGKNIGWKQDLNLGNSNNQKFVQIPFNLFESFLFYKSQKEGLNFISREESYTSVASALDLDPIPVYSNSQKNEIKFSGKRISRGMYRSKNGTLINADINGSYNILRKEIGDDFIISSNIGQVVWPVKINFN